MKRRNLALFGGTKTRTLAFPQHPVIGDEEKQAVMAVLDRGRLSTFIAAPGQAFTGGEEINRFEREFADWHGVKNAVAFNSATAALHAAVVGCGVRPGEEVIVPPYTFTSTATCALMHGAIPVFADIESETYGLDAELTACAVSPLTRAIIPVHLFGHPADMEAIMALARGRGLKVIEDCAQAPGATYKRRLCGTIGDCGIFSFTESKTITCGEGGMLITDDDAIADAARMVRNHGEVILEGQTERTYRSTMVGWNYRMTEMEAALGRVQFRRLTELNRRRNELADYLTEHIAGLPGLTPPVVKPDCTHVYYNYAIKYDADVAGVSRADFVRAVQAEGVPISAGYVRPLYLNPIYHDRRPAAFDHYKGHAGYHKGLCPVAERMHERDLILLAVARHPATTQDMADIVAAFRKVLENTGEIDSAKRSHTGCALASASASR